MGTNKIDELADYILAAERRKMILLVLLEKNIARPAELARELKVSSFFVFKAIHELEKKELIKSLEPQRRTWKKYKITNLGKQVAERLI